MIENLRFVKGVIKKKKLSPVLSHFRIADGRIKGSNGDITLCAPFIEGMTAQPTAAKFAHAISACPENEDATLSLTKAGRVKLECGKFKAFVDCSQDQFPEYEPEGDHTELPGGFLDVLKVLRPFIGKDATRPFCNGVLVHKHKLTVTNNVVCLQYIAGAEFTPFPINVPAKLVAELIRIGEEPTHFQTDGRSITFHYEGDRWVRAALLSLEWPDVDGLLNSGTPDDVGADVPDNFYELGEEIFVDATKLVPFTDDYRRLFISPRFLGTHPSEDDGARLWVERPIDPAILNIDQFLALESVATHIDLSPYPRPSFFIGDCVRGVIIGMTYNG